MVGATVNGLNSTKSRDNTDIVEARFTVGSQVRVPIVIDSFYCSMKLFKVEFPFLTLPYPHCRQEDKQVYVLSVRSRNRPRGLH